MWFNLVKFCVCLCMFGFSGSTMLVIASGSAFQSVIVRGKMVIVFDGMDSVEGLAI